MSFFVAKNETEIDAVMSPDLLMKAAPDYYAPRFEAIKDLRDNDDGTGHRGQEFRRVASFTNVPLFMASKLVEPDFLKDKRKFYAFIDRHPEYVTYQRGGKHSQAAKARHGMPLSVLGIDYPGGPATMEEFERHEVEPESAGEFSAGPATETHEASE